MKSRIALLTSLMIAVVAFSLAAVAQTVIDFSGLPRTGVLLPIPSGYAGMNWGDLDYFTEQFSKGPQNVGVPAMFGHGPAGSETMTSADPNRPYQLLGMAVTGQYGTTLKLIGYNKGVYVGSHTYNIGPNLTPIRVPQQWGQITQVTFVCRDTNNAPAVFALYNLTLQ